MPIIAPVYLIVAGRTPGGSVDRQALSRAARSGELVRIKRGAYVRSAIWKQLDPSGRHLSMVFAFAASHPGSIFSHESAALLLGLTLIGGIPAEVQVVASRTTGGRSEPGMNRRCSGIADSEIVIDPITGLRMTSVARTLVDLAISQPFTRAVAPLDGALRLSAVTVDELLTSLDFRESARGRSLALRAIEFGSPLAMFPGESLSRAIIHEAGFLAPDLQVHHRSPGGRNIYTDFEWLDLHQIGEFDGLGKYLKEEYSDGRTPGEIVVDEKRREDFLRSEGAGVTRWEWSEALARVPLEAKLVAAGIPIVRRPVATLYRRR